jgi:hypothetical protein
MTFSPKVTKVVTRPILKFENDKPLYVRILAALFLGTPPVKRPGSTRDPVTPTFVNVDNLEDNAGVTLPIHPKLKEKLTIAYPNDSYVGKCFMITKNTRQLGKVFTPYHLAEIEDPKPAPSDVPPTESPEKIPGSPVEEKPTQLHQRGRR